MWLTSIAWISIVGRMVSPPSLAPCITSSIWTRGSSQSGTVLYETTEYFSVASTSARIGSHSARPSLQLARSLFATLDPRLRYTWPPKPVSWRQRLGGRQVKPRVPPLPIPDPSLIAAAGPPRRLTLPRLSETLGRSFGRVDRHALHGPRVRLSGVARSSIMLTSSKHVTVCRFIETLLEIDQALTMSGLLPTYFALIAASKPLRPHRCSGDACRRRCRCSRPRRFTPNMWTGPERTPWNDLRRPARMGIGQVGVAEVGGCHAGAGQVGGGPALRRAGGIRH